MNEKEIYKLLTQLIGKIDPVGDSCIDEYRKENIEKLINLVRMLISDIEYVAIHNEDSPRASEKYIGMLASKFRNELTAYDN